LLNKSLLPICIIFFLLSLSCKTQNKLHESLVNNDRTRELTADLKINKHYIESIHDSLGLLIKSRDDKFTPEKFLVTEGRAKLIKNQAKDLVEEFAEFKSNLEPLNLIINGCEGHSVEWDVYCFVNMPYYGVEPILKAYILQYEIALSEISRRK